VDRNDKILFGALCAMLVAAVLLAFAPNTLSTDSVAARIWSLASSTPFIALISTFVAAFAGTWGAQLLAERNTTRRELLREIRAVNAAIALAFNISNTFITTKKQQVRDLVITYETQNSARKVHHQNIAAGLLPPGAPFQYSVVLQTLLPPFSPIEELRRLLEEKISTDLNPLILLTPLIQSIAGLADSFGQRNQFIEEFRMLPLNSDAIKAALYFGLESSIGHIDDRYPNLIDAISKQTDDCIAFSILLARALIKHGKRLGAKYGADAPRIAEPNLSKAGDLVPDLALYAAWPQ
jgi:hypothetical protein